MSLPSPPGRKSDQQAETPRGINELVFIVGICVAAGLLAAGLINRIYWLTGLGLVALPLVCVLAFALASSYEPIQPNAPPVPPAQSAPPAEEHEGPAGGLQ